MTRQEAARALFGRVTRQLPQVVPIIRWLPAYDRADLSPDVLAGLTSWGVMVPVALAYAALAGLPPEIGLVTAFASMAAYALFATSRHLKVTTSSTMAVMSVTMIAPLAQGDAVRFAALSAALALIMGAMLVGAGLLKLGFISEFLAKPVVTGFVIGVAITIFVGQLPKLLGVPGTSGSVFDQLRALVASLPQTNLPTLAVGLAALVLILVLRRVARRVPGPLLAIVLGIVAVSVLGLAADGVAVVGPVPDVALGLSLPRIGLGDLTYLITGALGVVFLALGESLGAGRSFAARYGYEMDGNQELVALGAANVSTGLVGGFIVDASLSQSATSVAAGGRTQLSSLLTAALMLATLLFLAPLFENLPMSVLAAVVIASVLSLIDIAEIRRYWAWRRTDALLSVVALVGVATTDVLAGLIIAVLLSLLMLLYRASRPYLAMVGRLPGDGVVYADLARHEGAQAIPELLLLRLDAPLYFFNASVARTQVLQLVDTSEIRPRAAIVDIGATHDLDVTTTEMLQQLAEDLRGRAVTLVLAQAKGPVRDRLARTGLTELIGAEHIHLSMDLAVEAERHPGPTVPAPAVPAPPDAEPVP